MTAITVGHATGTVQAPASTGLKSKPSFLARVWAAFVESRLRQAEREIALHRHLLPAQFEAIGDRLAKSDKDLPFSR